jgi:hypothetical protein
MGYIRKHREGIKTGFEFILLLSGILIVAPLIIYVQATSF